MSPEELERFFSKNENLNDDEIVQKVESSKNNLFITQRRNPPQFRTRAISN